MYQISALAKKVGLSRSTLLYYEKLGLITGSRLANGYRVYSERDIQRLRLVQRFQAGGLTLQECKSCLDSKVERSMLVERLRLLDLEIKQKQKARNLLGALLGGEGTKEWHESIDKIAPDAHIEFLTTQGFTSKEAIRLKWLSKNMNTHEQYMADFFQIFETLERWGPGSDAEAKKALSKIPFSPEKILEIGCGKGLTTRFLAKNTSAKVTAIDNEQAALDILSEQLDVNNLSSQITVANADMANLPFKKGNYDVIWAEGCAYIMGVENALKEWKKHLKNNGVLVISDLIWTVDTPAKEVFAFWNKSYPDMTTKEKRIELAVSQGYQVLDSFSIHDNAWQAFYNPLQAQIKTLKATMPNSQAILDNETEIAIYNQYKAAFTYQFFILQKTP